MKKIIILSIIFWVFLSHSLAFSQPQLYTLKAGSILFANQSHIYKYLDIPDTDISSNYINELFSKNYAALTQEPLVVYRVESYTYRSHADLQTIRLNRYDNNKTIGWVIDLPGTLKKMKSQAKKK